MSFTVCMCNFNPYLGVSFLWFVFSVVTVTSTPSTQFYLSYLDRINNLVRNSVQASSQRAYSQGWSHWSSWCAAFGTTTNMSVIPPEFSRIQSSHPFREVCLASFMSNLATERKLHPKSVSQYVSSVRYHLKCDGVDTSFVDSSEFIRAVRSGLYVTYYLYHNASEESVLPITPDMIYRAEHSLFNTKLPRDQGVLMAFKLAYCCLFRVSEYLPIRDLSHYLRSQDVVFNVRELSSSSVIQKGVHDIVPADKASLESVTLFNRSSKNDDVGRGERFTFSHHPTMSSTSAFNFTADLFDWAILAKPPHDDPFLSYKNEWHMCYDFVNKAIKRLAQSFNLDPSRFSTHSLRIGGATTLAAAGCQDSIIKLSGRWKSSVFLQYIRQASKAHDLAIAKMTDLTSLSVSEVLKTHSGASRVV